MPTQSFLTGVPRAGQPGIRNGISVDQFAAKYIGDQRRFASLAMPAATPRRTCRFCSRAAAFDTGSTWPTIHKPPLYKLYVRMLQRLGVEVDSFNTSTGSLTGLDEDSSSFG